MSMLAHNQRTPGVYISEVATHQIVIPVPTSIPIFIGYTEQAMLKDRSLIKVPTSISSLSEFEQMFGKDYHPTFELAEVPKDFIGETIMVTEGVMVVKITDKHRCFFYSSIQLFFQNGGKECFILSVGTYGDKGSDFQMDLKDYYGDENTSGIFQIMEQMNEPSLVVLPDITSCGKDAYILYQEILSHCQKMENRFAILDVLQEPFGTIDSDITNFRNAIGSTCLNYGAAYYPWIDTDIISEEQVDLRYLNNSVDLSKVLPEQEVQSILVEMKAMTDQQLIDSRSSIHAKLIASSETYYNIMEAIRKVLNLLPASSAMAGIYCAVDNTRGVWKAPCNLPLKGVEAPHIFISDLQQLFMNIDAAAGKSVNAIRAFPGLGTLAWGARTLDGNSGDWRYISVRRTLMMIEESVKIYMRTMIFEPNTSPTWNTIQIMIDDFLINLWRLGALAGSKPQEAFNVQIGLGTTMTAQDILNKTLKVQIGVAVVRPSEFIIVSISQAQA